MVTVQAAQNADQAVVLDLFREYDEWLCSSLRHEYDAPIDAETLLESDVEHLQRFFPPEGRLLLAYEDEAAAGCCGVQTIGPRTAEIQRMYVRPTFRRRGIGRVLVEAAIREARAAGYSALRLASAGFMKEAHALYRRTGFHDIAPYAECEVPEAFRVHYLFMEQSLNH